MLASFDFLGPQIILSVQNNRIHKTSFGGIASLAILLIFCFAFLGFGQDMFYRVMPRVSFNKVVSESLPLKIINDRNFLFTIYDQYTFLPIPDFDRRFTVYFDYNIFSGAGGTIRRNNIPIEKCSQEALKLWDGYFNINRDTYFCFPKNTTWDIKGVFSEGAYAAIRLQVDYCKNNTNPTLGQVMTNCIPKNETQTFLSGNRIQMHYIVEDTLVDNRNYTNPTSRVAYTGLVNTNAFTWTRMTVLFKKMIINTDTGFFLEDFLNQNFNGIESITSESISTPETNTVYSHLIGNSRWNEIYNREYIKIQDIFAMMGGFINIGMIVLRFVVYYTTRPKLVDLFNKTYRYLQVSSENSGNEKRLPLNSINKINISSSEKFIKPSLNNLRIGTTSVLRSEEIPKLSIHTPNDKIKIKSLIENPSKNSVDGTIVKRKCKANYSLHLSFISSLCRLCCLNKRNYSRMKDAFHLSEKKLNKVMSFENLTKMTKFVKLMGTLMLEDYQKKILKLCPAPKRNNVKKINSDDNELEILTSAILNNNDKFNIKLIEYLK
jgi:hypothetical protein